MCHGSVSQPAGAAQLGWRGCS